MQVISDTGPIIALAKVKKLTLLKSLFEKVYITPTVYKELMAKIGFEGEEIDKALNDFVEQVKIESQSSEIAQLVKELGAGEKQCIEYAYTSKEHYILVMDDKAARRAAKQMGIKTVGTIGILLKAKQNGSVDNITKILIEMRNKGYWLSDEIIKTASKMAEE